MPVLLIVLALGVFAYLYWRHRSTTLTRDCRWRQDRRRGIWRCAFCGAQKPGTQAPRVCLRPKE
ncbi:MAG: hypothetical protein KDK02_09540 [Rhodobacteraceae bacterium]|nr:hypothetical protein [Paracoccaceae bacterium]